MYRHLSGSENDKGATQSSTKLVQIQKKQDMGKTAETGFECSKAKPPTAMG